METFVTTLYNSTTGHHSVPLVFDTKEQAITTFINEIKSPESELANIKDTLSIYLVGTFDHRTGKLKPLPFFQEKKLLLAGKEVTLNTPKETK